MVLLEEFCLNEKHIRLNPVSTYHQIERRLVVEYYNIRMSNRDLVLYQFAYPFF